MHHNTAAGFKVFILGVQTFVSLLPTISAVMYGAWGFQWWAPTDGSFARGMIMMMLHVFGGFGGCCWLMFSLWSKWENVLGVR